MSVTRFGTYSFTTLESPFLDQEIVLRGPDGERDGSTSLDFLSGAPAPPDSWTRPETEQEILGGNDDRQLVANTLRVPNQWICAIDVMSVNPAWPKSGPQYICKSRGTGTLMGSRYLLTAAHIFGADKDAALKLATVHTVSPARNGSNSSNPFGRIKIKAIHFPPSAIDYALVVLDKDVSASTHKSIKGPLGYWGQDSAIAVVKRLDPAGLQNQAVDITGYPGDACGKSIVQGSGSDKTNKIEYCWQRRNDEWASTQWRSTGTLRVLAAANVVYHTADTYLGQSGSPICLTRNGILHLVAIHTGPFDAQRNTGVPVTLPMLQEIAGWINADLGYQGASIQNDALTIQPKTSGRSASVHVQRFGNESVREAFEDASEEAFDLERAFDSAETDHEDYAPSTAEIEQHTYASAAIPEPEEEEPERSLELNDFEATDPELSDLASFEEGETPEVAARKLGLDALPRHLVTVKGKDVALTPDVMDPGIYKGPVEYKVEERLQKLLADGIKKSKLTHIKVGLVDLTKSVNTPEFAGHNHDQHVYAASVPKIAAMLGAFQLRHDLRGALAQKKSKTLADLYAAVRTDWKGTQSAPYPAAPELEQIFADASGGTPAIEFKSTGETKEQLTTLIAEFNATYEVRNHSAAAMKKFEAARQAIADLGFLERLRVSIGGDVPASNYATGRVVRNLGYVYVASSLVQSGLYDGKRKGGLWMAYQYWAIGWSKGIAFGRGIPLGATAGSLAAFMTLLAQDRLVSPQASIEMKALMKKEPNPTHPGIVSWFKEGLKTLTDEGRIKRLFSKLGDDGGIDDCTLIERHVKVGSADKLLCYVAVGLRSYNTDQLIKLILVLDKCILANNGLTPKQGGHPDPSVAP